MVEEVEEEHKIGEVHEERPAQVRVADIAAATLALGQVDEHVYVHAPNHLRQLQGGNENVNPLGYAELHGAECVVRVHERVDGVVDGAEPARRAGHVAECEPAVDEHRRVVVPVQEHELLFAEHHK